MNIQRILMVTACLSMCAGAALAEKYSVSHSVEISNPEGEAWNVIGDFCDLDDWHPAVVACALKSRDGSVHRLLKIEGGAEFVEKLIAVEPGLSYTYSIIESPLPLEKYAATLSITRGNTTTVTWSGNFTSDDPTMEGVIADIYKAGLAAIEARFPK